MKPQTSPAGIFDMDRLARVFTWLIGALVIFVLGMVFMQAINADIINSSTTATTSTTTTTN